jgi:hypothetical protein
MKQHRYTLAQYVGVFLMIANLGCFVAALIVDGRMRATASMMNPDPSTGRIVLLGVPKPTPLYVRASDVSLFNWLIIGGFSCLGANVTLAFATGWFSEPKNER